MRRLLSITILACLSVSIVVGQKTDPYFKEAGGYGYKLSKEVEAVIWWCEGAYKVMLDTPLPRKKSRGISLRAAKNEYEPVQLVISPFDTLKNFVIDIEKLKGPYGEISEENIDLRLVEYVKVNKPTDSYAYKGLWPDPLPHLEDSIRILPGRNTSIWINFYIPPGSQPGIYNSTIRISSDKFTKDIPLNITVGDFELPESASIRSGFGLSVDKIAAYHNISDPETLKATFDLYMKAFRAYKISPYNFYYLNKVKKEVEGVHWEGGYYDASIVNNGKYSLRAEDYSYISDPGVSSRSFIPVRPGSEYIFSWQSRSDIAKQEYTVHIQGYDKNDSLLVFESRAESFSCDTNWAKERYRFNSFGDEVRKIKLSLYPVFRTAEGSNTGTVWFDDLQLTEADSRTLFIPGADFEINTDSININLDFSDFDIAAARYIDSFGFNAFRLYLDGMGSGSYYSRTEGVFEGFNAGTEEYEKLMAQYLRQIQDHLEEKGWLGKEYIYWFDEPGHKDYPFVREGMELIKKSAPKLTTFLTENEPGPEILDVTDISCTILHKVDPGKVKMVRDNGGEYWSYLCTGPKAPWISEFIDHDAINLRMWLWMSYAYRLNGILIWSTNYWTSYSASPPSLLQNPWEEAASYVQGYGWPLGKQTNWGNGDGRFWYPPNRNPGKDKATYIEGPIPSLRLEFLRQGIEDYEYFVMLERLLEEYKSTLPQSIIKKAGKLLTIPSEIFTDGKTYTKDPSLLYKYRLKLADQIEEIQHLIK